MENSLNSQRHALVGLVLLALVLAGCTRDESAAPAGLPLAERPAILLVTLDTTRADYLGIESASVETPAFSALAARGQYFRHAYSTTPTTLPSHTSMMSGLYPAAHGIRENGRQVGREIELLAPKLEALGYRSAAFVSGFPLAARFGLARGFATYDDALPPGSDERSATATTDAAIAYLSGDDVADFVWVHYFDAHAPYAPPAEYLERYPDDPYAGEIAYMDAEFGRLLAAFESRFADRPRNYIVVGDHGEGLGDHGEALHGNLLYQSTMRVPLIVAGDGIDAAVVDAAAGVHQVHDTVLAWAGGQGEQALTAATAEPVLGEALKPYLQYGWQPQFMAVQDGIKIIQSGELEVYDVDADPGETNNLAGSIDLAPALQGALSAYAARALDDAAANAVPQASLSEETLERLASLGYVGTSGQPQLSESAPSPKDRVHLFAALDAGSGYFTAGDYAAAIRVFEGVLEQDPNNFMAVMRLAVAHSVTDRPAAAEAFFERARDINPTSVDLRHYHAMHYLKNGQPELAEPLFESVLQAMPDREPALQALAEIYARSGRNDRAKAMLTRIVAIKPAAGREYVQLGRLHMADGETGEAIAAFEQARGVLGHRFSQDLELGVLYLADRRYADAAASLDDVPRSHPAYPMALFKRAQASVLLDEPDKRERVRRAWQQADATTRRLILSESLFRGIDYRGS